MIDEVLPRSFESSLRLRLIGAGVVLASFLAVSACTLPSLRDLTQSAGGALEAAAAVMDPAQTDSADPLLVFLAEAEEGEVRDVDDAATGTRLRVTAGRAYHAASGRICRRFSAGGVATPDANEGGLACRDPAGRWLRARLLAPVSP